MFSFSRVIISTMVGIAVVMVAFVCLHIGGVVALRVGQFSPLIGALLGGSVILFNAIPSEQTLTATAQPLEGYERISWILLGIGVIAWGIGESIWRYYIAIGQNAFPSLADLGY